MDEEANLDDARSDASSSSSDGSENESEIDPEPEEAAIKEIVGKWDPGLENLDDEGICFARHKISRCIHVMQDEAGNLFKCGRRMGTAYVTLREASFHAPTLQHMFQMTAWRSLARLKVVSGSSVDL